MAIARIQAVSATASSVSISSTTNGDLILVWAYFAGTATIPTLPGGFTSIVGTADTSQAARLGYKISSGGDTTSGTWTNATQVVCHVYRGTYTTSSAIGTTPTINAGNGTTLTYSALSPQNTSGSSWAVAFGGAASATAGMDGDSGLYVNRTSQTKANGLDTGVISIGLGSSTLSVTGTGRWQTVTLEIKGSNQFLSATLNPTAALSWTQNGPKMLIDYYSESNQSSSELIDSNAVNNSAIGHSFYGTGAQLATAVFYIRKVGSPTGNATATVYAATGTLGSTEHPTGSALATSDLFSVSTLSASYALTTFTFSGANQITLTSGTRYCVALEYSSGSSGNSVEIGTDSTSPTHNGNESWRDSVNTLFQGAGSNDVCFYVYGQPVGTGGLLTNLYAYYKLDEASGLPAFDSGGNTVGQIPIGSGAITSTTGLINTSRSFAGSATTQFVAVDTTKFSPGTNHFSFSVWIKLANTTQSGNDTGFLSKYQPATNKEWILWYDSGAGKKFKFAVGINNSTITTVTWATSPSAATWYHVCCGWDGTNAWISVNAGTRVTGAFAGPVQSTAEKLWIGEENGSSGFFNGQIDEFGFWMARDLNSSEITSLYNSGAGLPLSSFSGVGGGTSYTKSHTATWSSAAVLKRSTGKILGGTLSFIGTVVRRSTHTFTATLSFIGTITRRITKGLTALLSFIGGLSHRQVLRLSSTLSFVGTTRKLAGKNLSGLLPFENRTTGTTWVSDGSTSSIQNLHDNFAANGDTITIPSGSFTWTSGITISKGITLLGAGGGWCKGSSNTSNTIGTSAKTFTVQTGLGYVVGETIIVRQKYSGATNSMTGTVTSYSGTSLVVNVTSVGGSGTFANWNFEQIGATKITYTGTGTGVSVVENTTNYIHIRDIHWVKSGSGAQPVATSGSGKPMILSNGRLSMAGHGLGHGIQFNTIHAVVYKFDCDTGLDWPTSGGFTGFDTSQFFSMPGITQTTWAQTTPAGMLDTTGENNIYIEDCHLHGAFSESIDIDGGARLVLRNCVIDNCALTSHGQDTGNFGLRWFECYDNLFIFDDMSSSHRTAPLDYFFYMRGGTGLFTDNVIPNVISSDYGNKAELKFTVQNINRNGGPYACWLTYPAPRQVGFGNVNGSGITDPTWGYRGDSEPIYLWNNTGGGNYDAPGIDTYTPDECGNGLSSNTFVQSERDYFTGTPRPGYTKYTYPHPLQTTSSVSTVTTTFTKTTFRAISSALSSIGSLSIPFHVKNFTAFLWGHTSIILDRYSETNNNASYIMPSSHAIGQTFDSSSGGILDHCIFSLNRTSNPTGNVVTKLFATTGTFGVNAIPTGAPLAISDSIVAASIPSATYSQISFTFTDANRFVIAPSTIYAIVCEYTGTGGTISVGRDQFILAHPGNACAQAFNDTWSAPSPADICFYVYIDIGVGSVGALSLRTGRGLAATRSFVGSLARRTGQVMTASLSFVGNLVRSLTHVGAFFQSLSANLLFTGNIRRRSSRFLTATLSFVGNLITLLNHVGAYVLTIASNLFFIGQLRKRTGKSLLVAILSFSVTLIKQINGALTATLSFVGALMTRTPFNKLFTATLSFVGTFTKTVPFHQFFTATLTFSSNFISLLSKNMIATLRFVSQITKRTKKPFETTLSFIVVFVKNFSGQWAYYIDLRPGAFRPTKSNFKNVKANDDS